jgi:hypothetical protein
MRPVELVIVNRGVVVDGNSVGAGLQRLDALSVHRQRDLVGVVFTDDAYERRMGARPSEG